MTNGFLVHNHAQLLAFVIDSRQNIHLRLSSEWSLPSKIVNLQASCEAERRKASLSASQGLEFKLIS
jgi:hypothetical protein